MSVPPSSPVLPDTLFGQVAFVTGGATGSAKKYAVCWVITVRA
jgi:hypothetical protein